MSANWKFVADREGVLSVKRPLSDTRTARWSPSQIVDFSVEVQRGAIRYLNSSSFLLFKTSHKSNKASISRPTWQWNQNSAIWDFVCPKRNLCKIMICQRPVFVFRSWVFGKYPIPVSFFIIIIIKSTLFFNKAWRCRNYDSTPHFLRYLTFMNVSLSFQQPVQFRRNVNKMQLKQVGVFLLTVGNKIV